MFSLTLEVHTRNKCSQYDIEYSNTRNINTKYYHVLVFGLKIWDWIITCFVVGISCFMVAYLRHSYSCSCGLLLIYFHFQIHLG
jgi:hypothetical protein